MTTLTTHHVSSYLVVETPTPTAYKIYCWK